LSIVDKKLLLENTSNDCTSKKSQYNGYEGCTF
jgi:hypothetical protein